MAGDDDESRAPCRLTGGPSFDQLLDNTSCKKNAATRAAFCKG